MKYKTKINVVDAFVWTGGLDQSEDPEWIVEAIKKGTVHVVPVIEGRGPCVLVIEGPEGESTEVFPGGYAVLGSNNVIFGCRPELFESVYEKADE